MARIRKVISKFVEKINDKNSSIEIRAEVASKLYALVLEDGPDVASEASTSGAVASLVQLLVDIEKSTSSGTDCAGLALEHAVDALVALIKEIGPESARDACIAGGLQPFAHVANAELLKASTRAAATWAIGYLVKCTGQAAVAEARSIDCAQMLIALLGNPALQPEIRGKAAWSIRILAEVGGSVTAAEARVAGALTAIDAALLESGLPEWVHAYLVEARRIIAEPPPALPPLPLKATPRGFGSNTPRTVGASAANSVRSASARSTKATPRSLAKIGAKNRTEAPMVGARTPR